MSDILATDLDLQHAAILRRSERTKKAPHKTAAHETSALNFSPNNLYKVGDYIMTIEGPAIALCPSISNNTLFLIML